MPQSTSSTSEHGLCGCRRYNWRSWTPQLTPGQRFSGLSVWFHCGFTFLHCDTRWHCEKCPANCTNTTASKPPRNELLENPLLPVQWLEATRQPCSKMWGIKLLDGLLSPSTWMMMMMEEGECCIEGGVGISPEVSKKVRVIHCVSLFLHCYFIMISEGSFSGTDDDADLPENSRPSSSFLASWQRLMVALRASFLILILYQVSGGF